jgi:hypothetical protein
MGYVIPGATEKERTSTPQPSASFSHYWLKERYDGDLNNVEGIYQHPTTGNWVAESGTVIDINPDNGRKGVYQYMATPAVTGWIDMTPPKYINVLDEAGNVIGRQEVIRNRHGLYSTDQYLNDDRYNSRRIFDENPNTGEKGKWVWLGTMGWMNTESDPQPEPEDGTITFGAGGEMAGSYDSARDNPNGDAYATSNSQSANNQTGDSSTASNPPVNNSSANNPPVNNSSAGDTTTETPATPPANTAPATLERTGMLDPVGSSWIDVMNRQGANIDSWDSYLGMFTNQQKSEMPNWASLDSNQVESQFSNLAGNGLFTDLSQADVYANLLKRLGYGV